MRELAMWSIALLVNTSTWPEMLTNWRLVCLVFLNHLTDDDEQMRQYRAHLLGRIEKIVSDPNSSAAIANAQSSTSISVDSYEFPDDEEQDEQQSESQPNGSATSKNRLMNGKTSAIVRCLPSIDLI